MFNIAFLKKLNKYGILLFLENNTISIWEKFEVFFIKCFSNYNKITKIISWKIFQF